MSVRDLGKWAVRARVGRGHWCVPPWGPGVGVREPQTHLQPKGSWQHKDRRPPHTTRFHGNMGTQTAHREQGKGPRLCTNPHLPLPPILRVPSGTCLALQGAHISPCQPPPHAPLCWGPSWTHPPSMGPRSRSLFLKMLPHQEMRNFSGRREREQGRSTWATDLAASRAGSPGAAAWQEGPSQQPGAGNAGWWAFSQSQTRSQGSLTHTYLGECPGPLLTRETPHPPGSHSLQS